MPENVVVAVDGDTASESALRWVIERGRSVDMHLEILSVADIDWIPQIGLDPVLREHERLVEEARQQVESSGVAVQVSTTVHHARPVPGLVEASRRADLLVIGSDKTPRAVGLINGTLPLAVAARTQCPLVVVPVGWKPGAGPVVVGVDDDSASAAAAFAVEEARRARTTLLAVRAWDIPPLVSGVWATIESPLDAIEEDERRVLDGEVARMRAEHADVPIEPVLEYGRPSVVLSKHAADARLTVVGTHGRRAIAGLLLGSVSHDLLMNMPSPVAVVPDPLRSQHGSAEGASLA